MTCAGLLGLAVGFGLDHKSGRPAEDAQVRKGLKYLAQSIGEPGGAPGKALPKQELYLMWSIERVAVLYQLKTIEGKKWYEWGVELLTAEQKADGSWSDAAAGGVYVDTSFALLFLVRANLAQDLTDKLEELNARPEVVAAPPAGKQ
jgi:hypothetical protein